MTIQSQMKSELKICRSAMLVELQELEAQLNGDSDPKIKKRLSPRLEQLMIQIQSLEEKYQEEFGEPCPTPRN